MNKAWKNKTGRAPCRLAVGSGGVAVARGGGAGVPRPPQPAPPSPLYPSAMPPHLSPLEGRVLATADSRPLPFPLPLPLLLTNPAPRLRRWPVQPAAAAVDALPSPPPRRRRAFHRRPWAWASVRLTAVGALRAPPAPCPQSACRRKGGQGRRSTRRRGRRRGHRRQA